MVMRLVRKNGVRGDWRIKPAKASVPRGRAVGRITAVSAADSAASTDDGMSSDARDEPDDQPSPPAAPPAADAPPDAPQSGSAPQPEFAQSLTSLEQPDGVVATPTDDANEADSADPEGPADESVPPATLEALLMGTHHPLTAGRLAELLEVMSTKAIRRAIQELNESYASSGRSFRIEQVAGGYQILTLPEFGDVLKRLHQKEGDAKLTKAALETLSIIAYKQPILRADVEAIRGVACGETIRSLMEKHLVKIAGRAEEPGRPILYGTTKRFLELFGLNSLKDLPQPQPAEAPPATPPASPPPAQATVPAVPPPPATPAAEAPAEPPAEQADGRE